MDRGYDDNKVFLKPDDLGQDYVIRLTARRKLLYHNKWTMAAELCSRRKGKVKTSVFYKGKEHEAYLSHIKVQVTASKKDIYLVPVYGITDHPMMLAANKEIKSKDDVVRLQGPISHAGKSRNISAAKSRCSSLRTFVCAS